MLILKGIFERKENEIVGIASTENPDRDREVIQQSGWELENFKKNPVILAGHDYFSFPIGKAVDIAIDGTRLVFKMVFSETARGAEAFQLVKEGVLNAFSVGFIPKEWRDPEAGEPADFVITKAELLEISLVSVPANAEAVVLAKGMRDNTLAQKIAERAMKNPKTKKAVEEKMTEEVECKDGDHIECPCGKTYIVKLSTQPEETPTDTPPADEGKQGEDGEGRSESPQEEAKHLVKGALKLLQEFQTIQNRKEDRK